MIKLHLGCGKRYIPGFIHIDIIEYPHIDICENIDNLSVFEDNMVDIIYNCHVLEHFNRHSTKKVLKEWYRVLKVGGILRTAVPDFESLCNVYNKTKDINNIIGPLMGRQSFLYNFHYHVFDFNYLKGILEDIGFSKVYRYDWRNTEHSDIDDFSQAYFPHMDKTNGILISLNIEAIK